MATERTRGLPWTASLAAAGMVALALVFLSGCAPAGYGSSYYDTTEIDDVQYLSSYGDWVYMPAYGTVWCPFVVASWQPFYYGHWIWTDDDWAWVSYEPYGWLVYHYGFWGYSPDFGWFWVPGDTWYPARVQWYIFGDYVGWAPIAPPPIVWVGPWDPFYDDVWIVIHIDDFMRDDIGRYRVDQAAYRDIAASRKIIKRAPEVGEVENETMRKVPVVEVREQPVRVHRRIEPERPASDERRETELKRIVLPAGERRRVEERAERVEKEVLTRRRTDSEQDRRSSREREDEAKRKRK